MASVPPPLPGDPARRRPSTPPPLPTRIFPTIGEAAEARKADRRDQRSTTLLDPAELERFRNLLVFARTAVEGRFQGRHKAPDLGGGGEFTEYLAYEPGHPVQDIDWKIFARSRKLVIRRFRRETDMDIHLLVDSSGSMRYHSGNLDSKGLHAARIAASLAYLMLRQGDKASITLFADRIIGHVPPGGTRRHLMEMLRTLVQPAYEALGPTDLPAVISSAARLIRRRGRLVILSDFLGPDPREVFDALAPFAHRRFEILLMRITDPEEMTLPNAPLARFVDMESGATIEVEPDAIRADYEKRMKALNNAYSEGGSRHRAEFVCLDTSRPYRHAIESYLGFRRLKG